MNISCEAFPRRQTHWETAGGIPAGCDDRSDFSFLFAQYQRTDQILNAQTYRKAHHGIRQVVSAHDDPGKGHQSRPVSIRVSGIPSRSMATECQPPSANSVLISS